MDKMLELIGVHGPIAGCFLAVGMALGLHIKKDERRHEAMSAKLSGAASRDDIVRIHDRIDSLAQQQTEQHRELVGHLLRLKQAP